MTVDDECSIYVGGISYNSTEENLRRVFDIYGAVVEVKIINDRKVGGKCYGFVTFTNPRSATDAINEMDGRSIDGRVVRVNEVKTRGGRLGFGQERFRNPGRGVSGDRVRERERDYNREDARHGDGHRERSRDRDHKRSRGYDSMHDRDRSRDDQVARDRIGDYVRHPEDVDQEREMIYDNSYERDRDRPKKMQKPNSNHESRDKDDAQLPKLMNGFNVDDKVDRELSVESSENDQYLVDGQLEVSSQKLAELHKEVSQMEELVNEKQHMVSKLQEKSKKLEDALATSKKLTSQRQIQLSKLHKHYAQVRDYREKLKISEQELQALVHSTADEIEIG